MSSLLYHPDDYVERMILSALLWLFFAGLGVLIYEAKRRYWKPLDDIYAARKENTEE